MSEWIPGDVSYAPRRPRRPGGFWRRQFGGAPTSAQRKFDVAFGLVMPLLCFYFDPIVFKGGYGFDRPLYNHFQLYAYTISALEMVALCTWPFASRRGGRPPAVLAGVLLAGAAFSFLVGLAILPFSVFGLLFIVGVFGFVPFLTGVVYLRNGWRAAGAAGHTFRVSRGLTAGALACGFFFAVGAPAVVQVSVTDEVEAALADVRSGRSLSPARLRVLREAAAVSGSSVYDELVWEYHGEPDRTRRARLAKAYAEVTAGGDIERRLAVLLD